MFYFIEKDLIQPFITDKFMNNNNSYPLKYHFNILVVGDSQTGKTSFLDKISKLIDHNEKDNINLFRYKTCLNDVWITIDFLEIPGGQFEKCKKYFSNHDAVLIFFNPYRSLTQKQILLKYKHVKERCGIIPYFPIKSKIDTPFFVYDTNLQKDFFYISSETYFNIDYLLKKIILMLTNQF
jgi:hypothetical protein